MSPLRKRALVDCQGANSGDIDCSSCEDSAEATAKSRGNSVQTTAKGQQGGEADGTTRHNTSQPWSPEAWRPAVDLLDDATVRQILLYATQTSEFARQAVLFNYQKKEQVEQTRVIDFDDSMAELDDIFEKYSSSSGSKEYKYAFSAASDIEDIIGNIKDEAHPQISYGTKENALQTLHSIAENIIDGDSSTLGSEVRKHFQRER